MTNEVQNLRKRNATRLNNARNYHERGIRNAYDYYIKRGQEDKVEMLNALNQRMVDMHREYYDFIGLLYT